MLRHFIYAPVNPTTHQLANWTTRNHNGGTRRAGRKFSVWQSLSRNRDKPLMVISIPPTISSSAISASLRAALDSTAAR